MLPEPLKMLKIRQRARSSASRDPAHWLSFEISRWRAPRPEEMLRLKDLVANMPTGVPYTEEQIMAMVRKGKQRGHIPVVGRVRNQAKNDKTEHGLEKKTVQNQGQSPKNVKSQSQYRKNQQSNR
ncbi:hypothetical protein Tco_0841245 [Tanacetum coccineum]|uniref:Uncharacterized protein n=1 Tax=Tanacetum coccineum TaxID=301880 RepID=A0ABQ5AZR3_9ASTR